MSNRLIVITRTGNTTVITGWRAWLLGAATVALVWLIMALVIFVWAGMAITLGIILLLAIPAVLVVALLWRMFGKKQLQ